MHDSRLVIHSCLLRHAHCGPAAHGACTSALDGRAWRGRVARGRRARRAARARTTARCVRVPGVRCVNPPIAPCSRSLFVIFSPVSACLVCVGPSLAWFFEMHLFQRGSCPTIRDQITRARCRTRVRAAAKAHRARRVERAVNARAQTRAAYPSASS